MCEPIVVMVIIRTQEPAEVHYRTKQTRIIMQLYVIFLALSSTGSDPQDLRRVISYRDAASIPLHNSSCRI